MLVWHRRICSRSSWSVGALVELNPLHCWCAARAFIRFDVCHTEFMWWSQSDPCCGWFIPFIDWIDLKTYVVTLWHRGESSIKKPVVFVLDLSAESALVLSSCQTNMHVRWVGNPGLQQVLAQWNPGLSRSLKSASFSGLTCITLTFKCLFLCVCFGI